MKTLLIVWCSILASLGAAVAREPEAIVFINSHHNLNYAKSACDVVAWTPAASECKSVGDPRGLGRRLENEVMSALAVNTRCGGVTVIRDPYPDYDDGWFETEQKNNNIRKQSAFWRLHLDYSPGQKTFFWTLFPYKAGVEMRFAGPPINGEGDALKVAGQICIAVTKRGANIR